ncbi:hypothetical protein J3P85_05890 [Pseudomonas sp. Z1-12]|uniref:SecDF P1 head subdomain-containing protein n=1 Tax=Pseudomonas sp. Z1-12 TaxID=2817408 RepID=UPI003DA896BF
MTKAKQALFVALGMVAALQCLAADIKLSSATDFSAMVLTLKQVDDPNPDYLSLEVTFSPQGQQRMAQATREAMHQRLRFFIDGVLVSTAIVQEVLNGPAARMSISREAARSLVPKLLEPSTP